MIATVCMKLNSTIYLEMRALLIITAVLMVALQYIITLLTTLAVHSVVIEME